MALNEKVINIKPKFFFYPINYFFLGIEKCQNETGEEISNIISKTAIHISESGSKLISVCTDNFSGNISALDEKKPFCAQKLSGEDFIRTPCVCHSLNLAIKDVFNGKFIIIKEKVIQLIYYFNEISEVYKDLPKVSQFKEIRWYSLFYCVSFIISHSEYIDQSHINIYNCIQKQFGWQYIFSILKVLEIFMKNMENDCASICDVFPNYQNTLVEIQNIDSINPKKIEDNIANEILNSLLNRFSSTVNLSLPIMAFLLTGNGLKKLNELSDQMLVAFDQAITTFSQFINNEPDNNNLTRFFEFILINRNSTILISQQNTFDSFQFWKKCQKVKIFGLLYLNF